MTWVSERQLVSAISDAGGFGVLACGSMGPERLAEEIAATAALTGRPFGVNLIVMHPQLDELADVCVAHGVGHVVLAGGLPPRGTMERLKAGGAKVVCFAPSLALAKKLVRTGADALVIEGMEAGGHIGPVSTSVLAQEILPFLTEVPVFVAGGIGHGEMIAAYLQMGAAGVQMGTVFVCAEESTAHPAFKQAFIRGAARDAVPSVQIDPEFKVIPVRALANNATRRFTETQIEVIGRFRSGELHLPGSLARDRALLGRCVAPRGRRRRRRERLADGWPERRSGASDPAGAGDTGRAGRPGRARAGPAARRFRPSLARRPDDGLGRAEPAHTRRRQQAQCRVLRLTDAAQAAGRGRRRTGDATAAARPDRRADRRQPRGRGLFGLLQPCRRSARTVRDHRPSGRGGAPHPDAGRRGSGRHDRGAGQRGQHRRRPEPPQLPLLPGDPRGDLPLVPGRADPARRPRRRRADGTEPGPARLCRGRDRGDADHRLDPGRDVRLRRADRSEQVCRSVGGYLRDASPRRDAAGRGRGDRPGLAARAPRRGHPAAGREPAGRAGAPEPGDHRAARDARPDAARPATWAAASSARCSKPTGCSRRTPAGCAGSARRSAPAFRPRPRSAACRRRHASVSATPATPICASG